MFLLESICLSTPLPKVENCSMRQPAVPDRTIPILLLMDGLICAYFAIFAYQIGLDPNPDWGRFRLILLLIGITLVSLSSPSFFCCSNALRDLAETIQTDFAEQLFSTRHILAYAARRRSSPNWMVQLGKVRFPI
jgi:hypothetical protein